MSRQLQISVKPSSRLSAEVPQSLFARLIYTREVQSDETDDGAISTIQLEGSRREEIDESGSVTIGIDDYANATDIIIRVETAQGAVLWTSDSLTPQSASSIITVDVPVRVFASVSRTPPSGGAMLLRAGRFVLAGETSDDFTACSLYVAAVATRNTAQTKQLRKILGLQGSGQINTFETAVLDRAKLDPNAVNALALRTGSLYVDGTFDVSIDIIGDEVGWLWLLLGPNSCIGYFPDAVPTEPRSSMIIMLPQATATASGAPASNSSSMASKNTTEECSSHDRTTLDFDERQLLEHADKFSDDPGSYCTPFENPQRILGERRFFTVLRIDQPEVSGRGSLNISRPLALDLAPPVRMTAVPRVIEIEPSTTTRDDRRASGLTSILSMMRLSHTSGSEPRTEMRQLLKRELFKPSLEFWAKWVQDHSKGRKSVTDINPIEWEGDPTIYQAASVAGGHVLEWRVQWRSNGYSLGDLSHTLTLAPRQVKRIAKLSWQRREQARRAEETEVIDALTQITSRARDYSDAVKSSLSEWSRGGSKSRTTGAAGGLGFALGPVVIGGGASHGSASSSSWQRGGRSVAAAEHQELRDAIRQYGEATRSLESTVVTEVTQEEEVEGVSEVVRNINYRHSLTVIYHEILRHLRVDTKFSGLRECLFVPLSITPFDIDKTLRWREQLRHGMLDRSLRWALDRLDEVATAWVDSDIPPGRRCDHEINYITGSICVQLSIERPREAEEGETMEDYYKTWTPFAGILGEPIRRVVERIERIQQGRDHYFQREVAPTMAVRWADRLRLELNARPIPGVDFTLATTYRFGQTVRIDFTVPVSSGTLTRQQLQQITIHAGHELPPGSVANFKSLSIRYFTDHFDHRARSVYGMNDLIDATTGQPETTGAATSLPLSAWERQNLRERIEDGVEKLITHLNANLVYYHKVIWWLMDRDELYMLLDGFVAPYGRRFENGKWINDTGRSLASVVERDPMAILGNTLVFRVAAGTFLGIDGHTSPEEAHRYYYDSQVRTEPLRVSLPTEGLYAQALMDKCEACEEHQGSTDWVLSQGEPGLETLADQLGTRRSAAEALEPTKLPETIISLQNAPAAPAPQGLSETLSAVTKADAFRDMAGLAGTQAAAQAAMSQAASLASGFGQMAVDLQKSNEGTKSAKQKLDNIKKARSNGLIDSSEAQRQASKALDDQNMSPTTKKLTDEPSVSKAIQKGADAKSPVEVTRQSKDGVETVKVGGAKTEEPVKASSDSGIKLLGSAAPGTNPGSSKPAANAAIAAFAARTGALKYQVTRNQVQQRLTALVANPDILDQGKINVCGPAAVLHSVLRRDPKLVTDFTVDLVEKGEANFGSEKVTPDSDLRNQTYQSSWSCPVAEWVAASSLRDDANWLLDFEGTPEETVAAATTPSEVEGWLKATGLYNDVRNEANLFLNETKSHLLGLAFDNTTDNILLIHAHLLRNAPVVGTAPSGTPGPATIKSDEFILNSFPNHWVGLAGQATESGGRIKVLIWSWGNIYSVDVPIATLEANYYGAVIGRT